MGPSKEITVNITLKVRARHIVGLENYLNEWYKLISFEHLPDTNNMYAEDKKFKEIVKQSKDLKNLRLKYIMDNNYRYERNNTQDN